MTSAAVPNPAVPPLLSSGWLTADTSAQVATGHVPVTADNTAPLPDPVVPTSPAVIAPGAVPGPGPAAEAWTPTSSFPWPALAPDGDGVVAVTPGMTGNGNTNDDPSWLPAYDGPRLAYGGAYAEDVMQGGLDATAQQVTPEGFNVMTPGANMGYERTDLRLMGNNSPGYVNTWWRNQAVTPPVKTANQFTAQPLAAMNGELGTLPSYANLRLSNSGGTAYYVGGPQAPQVSQALPAAGSTDPAAGWA